MENGEEGRASPTASAVDSDFATHGGKHMPQIPDVANEIKVLHVAMHNLDEL